jgi:hypothetical protein
VSEQIISADESSTGANSVGWRSASIAPNFAMSLSGSTHREEPAIFAWADAMPDVVLTAADVPGDGRFWIGARASDNGDGTWSYEYAVMNLTSNQGASGFSVPISGAVPGAIGFHDIHHHSGEPFDSTDWSHETSADVLTWKTQPFAENENANALRWGTLYNFRFVASTPPAVGDVSLDLFAPGDVASVSAVTVVPSATTCEADFNQDGDVNFFDVQMFLAAFSGETPSADFNHDGLFNFFDVQAFLAAFSVGCP